MFKHFRHMHISLAAKCQILFGSAVVLIISATLYVPWKRVEGVMQEMNLQTAEQLAVQNVMDHVSRENALAKNPALARSLAKLPPEPTGIDVPTFIHPRMIAIDARRSADLDRFERAAIRRFSDQPNEYHFPQNYRLKETDRYRLAMPLYADATCLRCHESNQPALVAPPPERAGMLGLIHTIPTTNPTTQPIAGATTSPTMPRKLLGIVVIDIPSLVNANQLFLNRTFILLAGVLAGVIAIAVFYVITTRLILQPVRVLQVTAEKVSAGDLDIRSDISTGDEFQQLSETFNTMLTNLKSSADQLRSINKGLDLKLGQLAETNVALYESNRLKSEFLANVSHELRTPLNSILGFAELLRDSAGAAVETKSARYLQNILNSGRNLLDLINDLLDLAKIEAGRMEIRSEPLSLGDVFEGLVNILKPLTEAKNVTIAPEVAAGVPIVQTDPAKLQQVLYNFLSNAIKFSPQGGKVDLLAQPDGDGQIRVSVTDQGPGIDPDKHEVIFEKFRQIDGSVTRQHSGTGLGLAISKELTSLLGGTIGVRSIPGKGACFWIVLPLKTLAGVRDVRAKLVLSS